MTGSSSDIKEGHYYTYDRNSNITGEDTIDNYGVANSSYYGERRQYSYDVNDRLIQDSVLKRTGEKRILSGRDPLLSIRCGRQ